MTHSHFAARSLGSSCGAVGSNREVRGLGSSDSVSDAVSVSESTRSLRGANMMSRGGVFIGL